VAVLAEDGGEGFEGLGVEEDILNLLLVMWVMVEPRELNIRVG
jgi:hypothetical protein